MILDETIEKYKQRAMSQRQYAEKYKDLKSTSYYNRKCISEALECEQIAEWLIELKKLRKDITIEREGLTDAYLLGSHYGQELGREEALKPIQKLLDDWFCDREDDANRVLNKISICIFEMTKEQNSN